jgi:hypothetical protein
MNQTFRSFEITAAVGEEHQEQQAYEKRGKLMPGESVHQFERLAGAERTVSRFIFEVHDQVLHGSQCPHQNRQILADR